MSPFDYTWHFKFAKRYWNFGYLKKGKVEIGGWYRIGRVYFARPLKAGEA